MNKEIPARFMNKVQIEPNGGCWNWLASKRDGYGRYHFNNKLTQAHRWLYEYVNGPISSTLQLDHVVCQNRACVNPDHLELVTQQVNLERGNSPFIVNKRKTHCKRGHEFTEENTHVDSSGYRKCRKCHKQRSLTFICNKKLGITGCHNSLKTHCNNGHEYTTNNTRVAKDGRRICKTCIVQWSKTKEK